MTDEAGQPRTTGHLPIAPHLRPVPPRHRETCPLYARLPQPADRSQWRHYDVLRYAEIEEALALIVEGEA